jgi:amino acid permease
MRVIGVEAQALRRRAPVATRSIVAWRILFLFIVGIILFF